MGLLVVLLLAVVLFVIVLLPLRVLSRSGRRGSSTGPRGDGPVYGDERQATESPAVVRQVWETAGTTSGAPRIGMVLSVEPEGGEPFVVEVEQKMARGHAQRIRPGHVVTVRYRPADPSRLVVVSLG